MENQYFDIQLSKETGTITSIVNPSDLHHMNWCGEEGEWGTVRYICKDVFRGTEMEELPLIEFCESEIDSTSVYQNSDIKVTVERFFTENGYFNERYTLKNLRQNDLFLEVGDFEIETPFNDRYTYADDCMRNRCHTHLWCGGNTTYVNAMRMGESDINLGLVMIAGAMETYSTSGAMTGLPKNNQRGIFYLDCEHLELLAGEEYVFEWQMFWHSGNKDFYNRLKVYPSYIGIETKYYTVYANEKIEFEIVPVAMPENLKIVCDGKLIETVQTETSYKVTYKPERLGEHRFDIIADDIHTYTEFWVSEELEKLIEKRLNFIVDHQQYYKTGSVLDGAFLIYDNEEQYVIFDSAINDHNACRERLGMALLLTKYLQHHENEKFQRALDKFVSFMTREFFNPDTGEVYDGVGRNANFIRLYNAPWVATFFAELYRLTKKKEYLKYILLLLERYYEGGGSRFYPNGFRLYDIVDAFKEAGMKEECIRVINWFKTHVDHIVENGLSYPKHEVNYEQTIVTPATDMIAEMARVTGDDFYKKEVYKHLTTLKRFNGHQPSFHLHEIPIRYWDDFWFGKSRVFGDTFPHYWSCLTADAYYAYYHISGDKEILEAAEKCFRNCLCLFNEKGEGSCAYVYPFRVDGKKGRFYDAWANDQDFALYYYLADRI